MRGKQVFELEIRCRKEAIPEMHDAETCGWSDLPPYIKKSYNLMGEQLCFVQKESG